MAAPSSRFPRPKILARTNIPEIWKSNVAGTWTREVTKLHRKYGPIVRIGPNRIAVDGSIGWSQVFGHRNGQPEFPKYPEYVFPGDSISILGSSRDDHRRQRRLLSHAFSDAALTGQEDKITSHIHLLVSKLMEHSGKVVNIVDWLNFTTFDIAGDLTFGESFGSLKDNSYHPWVANFFKGVRGNAMMRLMDFYPLLKPLLSLILGPENIRRGHESREMSAEKAQACMAQGESLSDGRQDFMTYMLRKPLNDGQGMTEMEIMVNAPALVAAGSETTSTVMSGFFFYLGQNIDAYDAVVNEVRGAFSNEEEIKIRSSSKLKYLHAAIEEAMRMYPPGVETPPRISPGAKVGDVFIPKGTVIFLNQWATYRNPENFADRDSFRPERWLSPTDPKYNTKYANDNRAAFKPFSHGSRDCLGKNLAYSELHVILSHILFRFDPNLEHSQLGWQEAQTTFTPWDRDPLYVSLKPRHVQ